MRGMMRAVEFKTILNNGVVTIPPEYISQWEGKPIRVILLDEAALPSLESTDEGKDSQAETQTGTTTSLLARLKQIKISAPSDFAENLDAYLNGEKNV
jgi:hypothetical protein